MMFVLLTCTWPSGIDYAILFSAFALIFELSKANLGETKVNILGQKERKKIEGVGEWLIATRHALSIARVKLDVEAKIGED